MATTKWRIFESQKSPKVFKYPVSNKLHGQANRLVLNTITRERRIYKLELVVRFGRMWILSDLYLLALPGPV